MADLVRHAPEDEALGARHPSRPHDDQVGVGVVGGVEDHLRGVAAVDTDAHLGEADFLGDRAPAAGSLLGAGSVGDRPLDLARDIAAGAAAAVAEGADDDELTVERLGQLGRLADRELGGLRSVCPHDHGPIRHRAAAFGGCANDGWRDVHGAALLAPLRCSLISVLL